MIVSKFKTSVFYSVSILFLFGLYYFKFSFFLEGKALNGWDTPGHIVLSLEFQKLLGNFQATGWSDIWFGGFPIFYFYPPFFYLIPTVLSFVLGVSMEVAVYHAMFFVICFLSYAIFQFSKVFFFGKHNPIIQTILGFISILFYLNYAGDGLQGTSLVGIIEGTFISSFSHALLLLAFCELEKFRITNVKSHIIRFTGLVSILFYSHLLTTVFFFMAFCLYLAIRRKEVLKFKKTYLVSFFCILFLVWPVITNYAFYSIYTSGIYYGFSYPPLLSILGPDIYNLAIKNKELGGSIYIEYIIQLLSTGRFVSFFAILLLAFNFKNFASRKRFQFTFAMVLFFLWLSLDHSFGYIFPNFKIHTYRAFDLFYLGFSLLFSYALFVYAKNISGKLIRKVFLFSTLIIEILIFLNFDPFLHQQYNGPFRDERKIGSDQLTYASLEQILSLIPKGSLVQPEVLRMKEFAGSPHYILPLLYKLGLKNNMGLTVESSLYATLLFNWQEFCFRNSFRWGTDVDWRDSLYIFGDRNSNLFLYLDFLRRSGVEYMFGSSPEFKEYIKINQNRLQVIADLDPFVLVKLEDPKDYNEIAPVAIINSNLLTESKSMHAVDFIKLSNYFQAVLCTEKISTNLFLVDNENNSSFFANPKTVSFLVLLSDGDSIGDVSLKQELENKGYTVFLVSNYDFLFDHQKLKKEMIGFLQDHKSKFAIRDNRWNFTSESYFPKNRDFGDNVYISDTAKLAYFGETKTKNFNLSFVLNGRIYLTMMLLSIVVFAASFVKIYTLYFSFWKSRE
ncbi:hypothetical protein CH361_04800 [Leptospira brenneri]|nr:hypothetical protein CH361_04800 [Leptospira brenneri]